MHTKVKKAMYKWNFTPSTKEIIKETGLKQHQVHAVLSYMLEKNQIYRKFNDEINSYTYHWIH